MAPSKVSNIDFTTFYNIVDGKQRSGKNVTQGINPATKEKLWNLPIATEQDVNDAVEAGKKAFKTFGQTTVEERKKLINKFIEVYESYEQEFTDLMCKETGKPRAFAANEVQGCKLMLSHHAGLDLPTETFEDEQKSVVTNFVPLGVVGAICPWNFPLFLAVGKLAPAILAGKNALSQWCISSFNLTFIYRLHHHLQAFAIHSLHCAQTCRSCPGSLPARCSSSCRRR